MIDEPAPADHAEAFHRWDAAYVLGALSPTERHGFEQHLEECPRCTKAVAELAALPGLLSTLAAEEALRSLDAESTGPSAPSVPITLWRGLSGRARRQRLVRNLVSGLVGVLVGAALVLGIVFLPGVLHPPAQPNVSTALEAVQPGPLSADVQLTSVRWGTKIKMACTYQQASQGSGGWGSSVRTYGLFATDHDGHTVRIATWSARPGQVVHADGSTDLAIAQIRALDIRDLATGAVLLTVTIS